MALIKKVSRIIWIGIISLIVSNKAKSSNLSEIDKRIDRVRNSIKEELKNTDSKNISVPFENYTTNNEWVNWGNWGNWNNWNNWAKWNDWRNWTDWNNWNNWINY